MARNVPLMKSIQRFVFRQYRVFTLRYGHHLMDFLELPVKVVLLPISIPMDIVGSAPRGFGVPELISKLSRSAIFVIATAGTYGIAWELGKKVICTRDCSTCCGWQAMQCTMCKGSGQVKFQVKEYVLKRGQEATAENIADAIVNNRAKLVHRPSSSSTLPYKDCPKCRGTGVMTCPECRDKFPFRISADNIMEPPWKACNIMKKNISYKHIIESMKDPSIAAFWLFTVPQIMGGIELDDDVKQKMWHDHNVQLDESQWYDRLRDVVMKREPGWETLQKALIFIDPDRAKDDPSIVKNIPLYKAKKALEPEVMKLNPPPRPKNWGELDLPLNASSWTKEDLKDPKKQYEMTVLLNAQKEIADKILDAQWEAQWRETKLNKMVKKRVQPYLRNIDKAVLPPHFASPKPKRKRWWLLWLF